MAFDGALNSLGFPRSGPISKWKEGLVTDGSKHSEHVYFVEAIKAGLLLREQNPQSRIKLRDISDSEPEALEVAA